MTMRHYLWMMLLIGICLTYSLLAESSSAVGNSPFVEVRIRFCGTKAQKPPLEKLYFRVSFRNLTSKKEWILIPSVLYSAPTQAPSRAGISEIDLLQNQSRTIRFLRFLGSQRLTSGLPNDGGGFQGVLLDPRTEITLPVTIDYWGRPTGPLPITGEVAHRIQVRGKTLTHYFRTPLVNASPETSERLSVNHTWRSAEQTEVALTVQSIGQFSIPDALATKCKAEPQ